MRYRRPLYVLLLASLLAGLVIPAVGPRPVEADHCADLEQLVAELQAETEELDEELRRAETELDRKTESLLEFIEYWGEKAAYLQEGTLAAEAQSELIQHLGEDFVVGLLPGILISLIAPHILPANVATVVSWANDAQDVYSFLKTIVVMDEISRRIDTMSDGSPFVFDDARAFADQNNLPKLKALIDLVDLVKDISPVRDVYDDWLNAGILVETLAGQLEVKRAELQAAAEALDRCVQEDAYPTGLWINEDGHTVEIVVEEGSNVVSAVYLSNEDAACPHGDRRPQYLQGTLDGETWNGTMWRCTRDVELVETCGLSSVYETSFIATISGSTISGTYRSEWYAYEYDENNPDGCHWVRDPSGDEDLPFTLTRLSQE